MCTSKNYVLAPTSRDIKKIQLIKFSLNLNLIHGFYITPSHWPNVGLGSRTGEKHCTRGMWVVSLTPRKL
jgi:hypothetical protein